MVWAAVFVCGVVACGWAGAAAEPSMRGAGETVLFSCVVGHKVVSVCGAGGKATYYYGSSVKVEISARALSFAERAYSGGGETQICFRNGEYIYIVYDKTVRTSFSSEGHNDPDSSSGLVVEKGGKVVSARTCASDVSISAEAGKVVRAGSFVEH